jgi:hypothetical protein
MSYGTKPPELGTQEYFQYVFQRLLWEPSERKARALIDSLGFDEEKSRQMLQDWRAHRQKMGWQVTS